jgi:hypothetical protein
VSAGKVEGKMGEEKASKEKAETLKRWRVSLSVIGYL